MTNAERIRQMTDENLACILGILPFTPPGRSCRKMFNEPCILQGITCNQCWLEWLKKEADCSDGADGGGFETTDAKFWILSYSQVYSMRYSDDVGAVMENELLEWYSHTNNKLKYPIGGGSSYVKYWLRSVYKTDDGRNLLVPQPSSGVLYTYSANPEPWVVPACIIA